MWTIFRQTDTDRQIHKEANQQGDWQTQTQMYTKKLGKERIIKDNWPVDPQAAELAAGRKKIAA